MSNTNIGWHFDNSYSKLPQTLLSKLKPQPVKNPTLHIFNYSLSEEMNLNFSSTSKEDIATIFSGNRLPQGSETIAQAYAGHQFGNFTLLGDGRALVIGEHLDKKNRRHDLQLKGSGKTPYSRNADGRAALGPMLREYIISEAMHVMKIPTTRSLAVVGTGEDVFREKKLKGAILTRVASSHIRIGTFQFALISKNKEDLKTLFNYTINRHYPELSKNKSPACDLLKLVQEKQINLVCNWMRVGFVHGVMNTDNVSISGETIDYGPCAFMDSYNPEIVFSSIDQFGRYSFINQPSITKWNLERFAETLLPLINPDIDKSIGIVKEILSEFPNQFKDQWIKMMRKKLGLTGADNLDEKLITDLLSWMNENKVDYTNTFCELMGKLEINDDKFKSKYFKEWKKRWVSRLKKNKNDVKISEKMMLDSNPLVIPRNHIVEKILQKAEDDNFLKINELLNTMQNPKSNYSHLQEYQSPPRGNYEKYVTYCGT
tara:strand:- start:28650 stop:30110 length:1461 start_codon:yes stop_codon:yes gene_type:complete